MKKILTAFIIAMIFLAMPCHAGLIPRITFKLEQKDYYFKTGREAVIPVFMNNTYGNPVSGNLSISLTEENKSAGFNFSSSRSNSTSLTVPKGDKSIHLSLGTSDKPAVWKINLVFYFNDGGNKEVMVEPVNIHFVSDESQVQTKITPHESASTESTGRSGSSTRQGMDPLDDMMQFDNNMENMLNQRQEMFDEILRRQMNQMPPGSMSRNPQNNPQSGQMPQDSQALKQSMQAQAQAQKEMKEKFRNSVARNPQIQQTQKKMEEKGYRQENQQFNPTSPDSGSFEMNYKKPDGETASIRGEMNQGKMEKLKSFDETQKKEILEKLKKNPDFRKFEKEMKKRGFKQEKPQFEQDGDRVTASIDYKKDDKTATARADFEDDAITNVEIDKGEIEDEKDSGFDYRWLPLILALAIAVYLIFRRKSKTDIPAVPQTIIEKREEFDYMAETERLVKNAREQYESGNTKEAFSCAGRALRIYTAFRNGLNAEKTGDEIIRHLKTEGKPTGELKKSLDICNLIEFAKKKPEDGEFNQVIDYTLKITGIKM